MRRSLASLVVIALLGCGEGPAREQPAEKSAAPTHTASSAAKTPTSPRRGPAPIEREQEPASALPRVDDATVRSEPAAGYRVVARRLVGKITAGDGLRFALLTERASAEPIPAGEKLDWNRTVASLRFTLSTPSGRTHTLALPEKVPPVRQEPQATGHLSELRVTDRALEGARSWSQAFTTPAAGAIDAPGEYTLTIAGELHVNDARHAFRLPVLRYEVVPASAAFRTIAELEVLAGDEAKRLRSLTKAPAVNDPVVSDTDAGRWLRMRLDSGGDYDIEVVDLLFRPDGALRYASSFRHFTCVAEGTPIETPEGPVAIEALRPGDRVRSFDPETRRPTTAIVVASEAHHGERLIRLGALRVTGAHPIYADGAWVDAADVRPGAKLIGVDGTARLADPQRTEEAAAVHQLSVSAPHTYFAGGVLVHNKAAYVPLGEALPYAGWFHRAAEAAGQGVRP